MNKILNKCFAKIFRFNMSGRYTRYEMYEIYIANYPFWKVWRDAADKIHIEEIKELFNKCKS